MVGHTPVILDENDIPFPVRMLRTTQGEMMKQFLRMVLKQS
jgi:hypothetical protein